MSTMSKVFHGAHCCLQFRLIEWRMFDDGLRSAYLLFFCYLKFFCVAELITVLSSTLNLLLQALVLVWQLWSKSTVINKNFFRTQLGFAFNLVRARRTIAIIIDIRVVFHLCNLVLLYALKLTLKTDWTLVSFHDGIITIESTYWKVPRLLRDAKYSDTATPAMSWCPDNDFLLSTLYEFYVSQWPMLSHTAPSL